MAIQSWAVLHKLGIVDAESPPDATHDMPWYVKVFVACSAWIASLFTLAFIGLVFQLRLENVAADVFIGGLLLVIAYLILQASQHTFTENLGLALSFAGQVLMAIAIFQDYRGNCSAWLLLLLLQSLIFVCVPNNIHTLFSAFVGAIAFAGALSVLQLSWLVVATLMFACAVCWIYEFHVTRHIQKVQSAGYGLLFGLIVICSTHIFAHRLWGSDFFNTHISMRDVWLSEGLTGLVMLAVVYRLLQAYQQPIISRPGMLAIIATILLAMLSAQAQGVSVGMAILCLGFYTSNRVITGLGVIALITYVSAYYYWLPLNLMEKACVLFVTGLGLLIVRLILRQVCGQGVRWIHD